MSINIVIVHSQYEDYMYDMNTYNLIAYLENNKVEFGFCSLSTKKYSVDEMVTFITYSETYAVLITEEAYSMCKQLMQKLYDKYNSIIYVYGAVATAAAEAILQDMPYVSGVIMGDIEQTLYDIAVKEYGEEQGVTTRKRSVSPQNFDIRQLPWVTPVLIKKGNVKRHVRINTSSGCSHNCKFCILNKKYKNNVCNEVIVRDIKDVLDEVLYISDTYGITSFFINDRNIVDKKSGKERIDTFCNWLLKYKKRLTFCCFVRADSFTSQDIPLLIKMRKNGFIMFDVGIEAGNDEDLLLYNKGTTVLQNHNILRLLKQVDIEPRINFIMVNPFSTKQRIKDNYVFLKSNMVYSWRCYISRLKLFYGTDIYFEARRAELLCENYSVGNVYEYKASDMFANLFLEYVKWIETKDDILRKTFMIDKIFEEIKELFFQYEELEKKYNLRVEKLKKQIAEINAKYFRFIMEEKIEDGYLNFDNFQKELSQKYFFLNIIWRKIEEELKKD